LTNQRQHNREHVVRAEWATKRTFFIILISFIVLWDDSLFCFCSATYTYVYTCCEWKWSLFNRIVPSTSVMKSKSKITIQLNMFHIEILFFLCICFFTLQQLQFIFVFFLSKLDWIFSPYFRIHCCVRFWTTKFNQTWTFKWINKKAQIDKKYYISQIKFLFYELFININCQIIDNDQSTY
jgi:hypothetical protein